MIAGRHRAPTFLQCIKWKQHENIEITNGFIFKTHVAFLNSSCQCFCVLEQCAMQKFQDLLNPTYNFTSACHQGVSTNFGFKTSFCRLWKVSLCILHGQSKLKISSTTPDKQPVVASFDPRQVVYLFLTERGVEWKKSPKSDKAWFRKGFETDSLTDETENYKEKKL